jgi:hypothetical protein
MSCCTRRLEVRPPPLCVSWVSYLRELDESLTHLPTSLPFSGPPSSSERRRSGFLHGDWGYRVVDVSAEQARRKMLDEEENVLRGYGRSGKGRMRGERWGRGESSAAAVASSTPRSAASEPTRKVYGAWGINDERPGT